MNDILLLVLPDFLLLDATGPAQVFSSANDEARDAGEAPPYRIRMLSPLGGLVASSSGVSVQTERLPRRLPAAATLIVSGGRGVEHADPTTVAWVQRAYGGLARCCSVCSGAFVLASAGLLRGRRAVTHWQDVALLRRMHPDVEVQDDALYLKDGKVYTSAGIAAGMDLAISLVQEDRGRPFALGVAKRLVLFLKRPGGQRQFSSELLAQAEEEGLAARLTVWLRPRLKRELDVGQMALACAMSVRTLHRRLKQEAAVTPAQLLLRLRMESACTLLERPGMTVKRAAAQSGFGSEYNLRRAFAAQLGVVPSEYQARFG